jgi:hypothetical protein
MYKKLIPVWLLALTLVSSCVPGPAGTTLLEHSAEYNFIVANDLGRNGYYDQKPIAETMGKIGETIDIEFIAAAGDVHHFEGVASVNDPLWMTNFEEVYSHPELMIDWFPILGNHEYRGNTKACLDYGKLSRRWMMQSRYYTLIKEVDDSTTLRLVFIDTAPLIDKYREDSVTYPDAWKQDLQAQLHFIDSVLTAARETWTVVIGHHPVYAYTTKSESERVDLQQRLDPILRKHKVDFYMNGHIHNFQHIRVENSPVAYVTNSSASLSRPVATDEQAGTKVNTLFSSDRSGFMLCSVEHNRFTIQFADKDGKSLYQFSKSK